MEKQELTDGLIRKYKGMPLKEFLMDCLGATSVGLKLGNFSTSGEGLGDYRLAIQEIFFTYYVANNTYGKSGNFSDDLVPTFSDLNAYFIVLCAIVEKVHDVKIEESCFMDTFIKRIFVKDTPVEAIVEFYKEVISYTSLKGVILDLDEIVKETKPNIPNIGDISIN